MLFAVGLRSFDFRLLPSALLLAKGLLILLCALVLVLVVGPGVALGETASGQRQREEEQQDSGEGLFRHLTVSRVVAPDCYTIVFVRGSMSHMFSDEDSSKENVGVMAD